jgi:hypothetical protein
LDLCGTLAFFVTLLIYAIIRYLSIYHGTLLNIILDDTLMWFLRILDALLITTGGTFYGITESDHGYVYSYLVNQDKIKYINSLILISAQRSDRVMPSDTTLTLL